MASKTDAAVKLVLVFFISLLSFSIGTFVGKKYSDNQHQLAALEPQKADRSIASAHDEGASSHKPGAMTDEEIAKLAEEFVADETAPTTVAEGHGEGHGSPTAAKVEPGTTAPAAHGHEEAAAQKPDAKSEAHSPRGSTKGHVTTNQEPSSAAQNIAAGKAPTETHAAQPARAAVKQEERRPTSLPKDVAAFTVGKFTVQVASYADEAEAQKFASELKDKGYSAFYIPANIKGKTWYRVSVGQFATQKEAQSYRAEFLSKSKVSSAIVQKITE